VVKPAAKRLSANGPLRSSNVRFVGNPEVILHGCGAAGSSGVGFILESGLKPAIAGRNESL
jgi:hypothetical protein